MGTDLSKQEAGNWKGGQGTGDMGQARQQKGEGEGKSRKGQVERELRGPGRVMVPPLMRPEMPRQEKGPAI